MNTKSFFSEFGFDIFSNIYSKEEIGKISNCIEETNHSGSSFTKSQDVFAIRQLLINVPTLGQYLFNEKLKKLIADFTGPKYFLSKAVYFDKPSNSNWFVGYHQDLSISVKSREIVPSYKNWTFKKNQHGVQPPLHVLQDTLTIRIHLDRTDKSNGALRVIPSSHQNDIINNMNNTIIRFDIFHYDGGIFDFKVITTIDRNG